MGRLAKPANTMIEPLRVFIGFDPVETVAYHVCVQSILKHASVPVSFTPINIRTLPEYTRKRDPKQSNEFSFTRFLTPYLAGYQGKALWMDCDMAVKCDIKELFDLLTDEYVVACVQHDYTPSTKTKFLGNVQYDYPRKNWSSLMLFNADQCRVLTPEYVSMAPASALHRLYWAKHSQILPLPTEYNHLVGEYTPNTEAKIYHWTLGTPCFQGYEEQEAPKYWYDLRNEVNYCEQP